MTTDNDDVTLSTHLRVSQRGWIGWNLRDLSHTSSKTLFLRCMSTGRYSWQRRLKNGWVYETGATVKVLLKNTFYFQCEYRHTRLHRVLEQRLNNDNQSPRWIPSFPTFDKCCSAPPPSYFSILFATLPSDWNTRESVNNVCFPAIMSPSRLRTSCLNHNIASCLRY